MSTGSDVLTQYDKAVIAVIAAYPDLRARSGVTTALDPTPNLPAVDQCIDPWIDVPIGDLTIRERVECRSARRLGMAQRKPSLDPTAASWIRLIDGQPVNWGARPAPPRRDPAALTLTVAAVGRAADVRLDVDGEKTPLLGFPPGHLRIRSPRHVPARLLATRVAQPRRAFVSIALVLTAVCFTPVVTKDAETATRMVLG